MQGSEQSLEKFVCKIIDSEGIIRGTGFFIRPDGYVITCYHVVKYCKGEIKVGIFRESEPIVSETVREYEQYDIAVLKINRENCPVLPLSTEWKLGDRVFSHGFSFQHPIKEFPEGFPMISELMGIATVKSGLWMLVLKNAEVDYGMSGAPAVNDRRNVIGILGLKYQEGQKALVIPTEYLFEKWAELKKYHELIQDKFEIKPESDMNSIYNIEKQEAGRDIFNVAGDIVIKQPTTNEVLIESIRNHNNDLREFLRQWKKSFPVIVFSESIEKCYDDFGFSDSSLLFTIEKHPLYEDMNYHLPTGYKDFFEKWNSFREQIFDYDDKRNDIFNNFKDYKEFNIKYPAGSIYARAVSLVKEENSLLIKYDYFSDIGFNYGTERVYYSFEDIDKDKIELIKNKHTDISKEYAQKYNKDIKEIINIERQLLSKKVELNKILEELTFYHSFPNMNCKFIKDR